MATLYSGDNGSAARAASLSSSLGTFTHPISVVAISAKAINETNDERTKG